MDLGASDHLLTEIGQSALAAAPRGWTRITLEASGMGPSTDTSARAETLAGIELFTIDAAGAGACAKLRKAMFKDNTGTWYRASFAIDSSRQLTVEFDYEAKLFDEDEDGEDFIISLLLDDQKRFPRDPEHLPDWHPAKRAA